MSLATPDEILTDSQGKHYLVEKYLGEGVTAEVYSALRQEDGQKVALKILRPNLPPEITQSFRDEASYLGELAYFEQEAKDNLSLVPLVKGQALGSEFPREFLAMELVKGEPLNELIAEQGTFADEVVALRIADQILRVLDILHTRLRRSYTDFQLKNIWWQAESQTIKIMDWNHVSVRAPEGEQPPGVKDDLTRFGAYFYQLLTGQGAFQNGETEFALADRAGDLWTGISYGTRRLIQKALHPNPALRWDNAAMLRQEVKDQINLWQQDVNDIYLQASQSIRTARRSDAKDALPHIQKAAQDVDMYIRRGDDEVLKNRLKDELKELTEDISPEWGAGYRFYKAEVYSEALSRWLPQAEALGRFSLWRWVLLSQIAQQLGGKVYEPERDEFERAIHYLEDGQWVEARQFWLAKSRQYDQISQLTILLHEAEAHIKFETAKIKEETGQWVEAIQTFEQVAELIKDMPLFFQSPLKEENGWDKLNERIQACEEELGKSERSQQIIAELDQALYQDFARCRRILYENYTVYPTLRDSLARWVRQKVASLPPGQVTLNLLDIVLTSGVSGQEATLRQLRDQHQKAVDRQVEEARLKVIKDAEEGNRQVWLKDLQTSYTQGDIEKVKWLLGNRKGNLPDSFITLLRQDFSEAIAHMHWLKARELHDLLGLIDKPQAEERQNKLHNLEVDLKKRGEAWFDNMPERIRRYLQNGQYAAAQDEIDQAEKFYKDDPARLEKVARFKRDMEEEKALVKRLDQIEKSLDHQGFDRARNLVQSVNDYLETPKSQWINPDLYQARLQLIRERIAKEEKKIIATLPLENALSAFSQQGLTDISERIKMEIKKLQSRASVSLIFAVFSFMLILAIGALTVWQLVNTTTYAHSQETRMAELAILLTPTATVLPPESTATQTLPPTVAPSETPTITPMPTEIPTDTPIPTETPTPVATPGSLQFSGITADNSFWRRYDIPDFVLTVPDGWVFDVSGDEVVLEGENIAWTFRANLKLTDNTAQPSESEFPILSMQVQNREDAENNKLSTINIVWALAPETTPVPTGTYDLYWLATANGQTPRSSEPISVIVEPYQTFTITNETDYWLTDTNASQKESDIVIQERVVPILGKRLVDPSNYFLIRVEGTRKLRWLVNTAFQEYHEQANNPAYDNYTNSENVEIPADVTPPIQIDSE